MTELRDIFLEDDYCTVVAETGYNKPLSQLSLLDRDELCKMVVHPSWTQEEIG